MTVFLLALKHLSTTPVDGASDNKLRQMIFEYSINEERKDFCTAAVVLSGMRMDDKKNSIYYFKKADKADGKCQVEYLTSHFFHFLLLVHSFYYLYFYWQIFLCCTVITIIFLKYKFTSRLQNTF